ncbi:MAG: hypothetical protein IIA45_13995 [Bacteroidetes bacterium]|nr:hypothetical protein [Bacteroidota bacterium]
MKYKLVNAESFSLSKINELVEKERDFEAFNKTEYVKQLHKQFKSFVEFKFIRMNNDKVAERLKEPGQLLIDNTAT